MAVAEKCDRSGIDRRGPFRIKENCTAAISLGVAVPCNQKLHPRSATEWTVRPPETHRTPQQDAQQEAPSQSGTSACPAPARRSARVSRSRRSRSGDTDNFHRKTTALRWSHSRSRKPREPRARTNARESAGTRRRHRCRRPQDSCRGEHDSAEPDTTESTGTELAGTGSIGRDKKGRVCFT